MQIKNQTGLMMTAMYMAMAANKACVHSNGWVRQAGYDRLADNRGGHVGIMEELADYAELSQTILEHLAVEDWPGVYEYEVAEPFGTWWINDALERGTPPDPADARKALLEHMVDFFEGCYSMETLQQACEAVRNGQP